MNETNELVSSVAGTLLGMRVDYTRGPSKDMSWQPFFRKKTGINPFGLGKDELFEEMKKGGSLA